MPLLSKVNRICLILCKSFEKALRLVGGSLQFYVQLCIFYYFKHSYDIIFSTKQYDIKKGNSEWTFTFIKEINMMAMFNGLLLCISSLLKYSAKYPAPRCYFLEIQCHGISIPDCKVINRKLMFDNSIDDCC